MTGNWSDVVSEKATREAKLLTPIRWRAGAPAGKSGTLYQFVREYLWQVGGSCSRNELLAAMLEVDWARQRLGESQGFISLLDNMRHSGEVLCEGEIVRSTTRALRRGARPERDRKSDPTGP